MSVSSQQECVSSFDDKKVDNVHGNSGPSLQIVQAHDVNALDHHGTAYTKADILHTI